MELPQHRLAVVIDVRTMDADHDHLADFLIRRHRSDDGIGLLLKRLRLLRFRRLTAAAGEQAERQKSHPQHDANHHAPTVSTLHLSRASYFPFSCESCFFSLTWPKHG